VADHDDARRAHGYHELRVKAVVQETHDTRSYVLDIPDELAETFRYRAGQFCTFRVHLDGEELLRCYSMSSAPETDADLTVTVKRVPGGLVSNWFHDEVAEGDVLEVTRPAGVFCVREGDRPLVAFCGGSGVTPVMSVARSALSTTDRPVHLLYANRDRPSVIFDAPLEALQADHADRFELRLHLDDGGGFLEPETIREFAAGHLDADFYICGPTPFMDLVEKELADLGVDSEHVLIERFVTPAPPDAPTVETPAPDAGSPPEAPVVVHVQLKGTTTDIAYQPGDTVLDTARRGGLSPPFSCEAGNCATCMALLHEGHVTMRANNALTPDEVAEGWILTCQSVPDGPDDLVVEYESF
jgi:ferredoxin-NADP reductase